MDNFNFFFLKIDQPKKKSFYQTILVSTSFTCCRWYMLSVCHSCRLHYQTEFLLQVMQLFFLFTLKIIILSCPYNPLFSWQIYFHSLSELNWKKICLIGKWIVELVFCRFQSGALEITKLLTSNTTSI